MPASWQQACWTATARAGLLAGEGDPDLGSLAGGAVDLGLAAEVLGSFAQVAQALTGAGGGGGGAGA